MAFFGAVGRFCKKYIALFLKGMAIGMSIIIPGVSGGTMAILLGIYERILDAVNNLFKNFRENIVFLLALAAGGLASILSLSFGISFMLKNYLSYTNFFFLGLIFAGLPAVYRESGLRYGALLKDKKIPGSKRAGRVFLDILPFAAGVGAIIGISFLQEGIVSMADIGGVGGSFFRLAVGVPVAVAFILPGISGSHFLKIIGLYDRFVEAVKLFDIPYLLPFVLGVLVGIFLTAKLMSYLLKRFRRGTFLCIMGFLAASLALLATERPPQGTEIFYCLLCAVGGAVIMSLVTVLARTVTQKTAARETAVNQEAAPPKTGGDGADDGADK
ncbi:MAG: DUF368 domain-containing protein [Clostridiales bacterium]|jgi:putative membrane protein|nr:DUF368 domain-containing protein [Clostridiales bacterium]